MYLFYFHFKRWVKPPFLTHSFSQSIVAFTLAHTIRSQYTKNKRGKQENTDLYFNFFFLILLPSFYVLYTFVDHKNAKCHSAI